MITKSGSNTYGGSFRVSFVNDAWSALTPYPGDANIDAVVPTYEVTAGGTLICQQRPWGLQLALAGFGVLSTKPSGRLSWHILGPV